MITWPDVAFAVVAFSFIAFMAWLFTRGDATERLDSSGPMWSHTTRTVSSREAVDALDEAWDRVDTAFGEVDEAFREVDTAFKAALKKK